MLLSLRIGSFFWPYTHLLCTHSRSKGPLIQLGYYFVLLLRRQVRQLLDQKEIQKSRGRRGQDEPPLPLRRLEQRLCATKLYLFMYLFIYFGGGKCYLFAVFMHFF
uniref:Uncharacterized protein n=1 Tax=Sphaerodactylus townsendi TaxID=933632 RepID=A0ACB8G828_9SAUR